MEFKKSPGTDIYQTYAGFEHGYDMSSKALGIGGKLTAQDLKFVVAKEGQVLSARGDASYEYDNGMGEMKIQPNGQRGRPYGPDVPFYRDEMDVPAPGNKTRPSPFR